MTDSTASAAPQVAAASFWEDIVDVFFKPSDVFRRREKASVWPPLLILTLLLSVFAFVNVNVLQPVMDAEWARQSALILKKNPNMTQEMLDKGRAFGEIGQRYGAIIGIPLLIVVMGLTLWLVGKLFGSRQAAGTALVVAAYSCFPRIIEAALASVQGLLMDPAKLTGVRSIQFNPARFLDPDATSLMTLALLSRVDLFVIWVTILLSAGVYATGKVSKSKAAMTGVAMWVLGSLPAIWQGLKG